MLLNLPKTASIAVLALACASVGHAQDAPPPIAPEQTAVIQPLDRAAAFAAHPLAPFVATYEVYNEGKRLGNATMQLVAAGNGRWRIDLTMRGTGLLRLTGLNAEQSVVFEENGGQLRPISQATTQSALMRSRRQVGVYNWNTRQATWRGDVRENRKGPVALQEGDMNGLLINLAMIRDASPGALLRYRYVDGGRARDHAYQADAATMPYEAGGIGYDALHLQRGDSGDGTEIWVAQGVPTPLRILQHEDGADGIDLRLIQYQ